ncbi:subtilisin-like protease 2, putative [Plasmodium knowlesi strain H]|nr:putative Subtilisin-like protease 2 [Plasmodium knowlesi]SBO19957.1 subtilisin-like protease 2, putative [Plasmodium knowlesi strain H]SBO20367.1 subtilisin-like protease 2, putative [Plasmodium knowlesi strain H]
MLNDGKSDKEGDARMNVNNDADVFTKLVNEGNIEDFGKLGEDEQGETKERNLKSQSFQGDDTEEVNSVVKEGRHSNERKREDKNDDEDDQDVEGKADQETIQKTDQRAEQEANQRAVQETNQREEQEANQREEQEANQREEQEADEESNQRAEQEANQREEQEADEESNQRAEQEADEESNQRAEQEADEEADQEAEYELKEGENVAQQDIIVQEFDHYKIVTNSHDILNDIYVDASDISKLSIGSINIAYSEQNKTSFTHQRHIVLNNRGNKKYRVVLMTKNPKFTELEDEESENAATNTFIEKEKVERKKTSDGHGEEDNDRTNLYGGKGTLDFSKAYRNNRKGSGRQVGNPNVEMYSAGDTSGGGIRGTINRLFSFLSFKGNPDESASGTDPSKDSGGRSGDNEDQKGNANEGGNRHGSIPQDDRTHDLNEILSVDKLVDQYLLNLKNNTPDKQELILVLRGDLDLHSPYMKLVIKRSNAKFEQHIKRNFEQIDKIVYDISSPINFLCFFVPTIFDMNNFHLLKEALMVLHKELERYMENWSFSNTYVTLDAPQIQGDGSGASADWRNDSQKKDAPVEGGAGSQADHHGNDHAEGSQYRKGRKFIKKKKKLYNGKYSFLRKIWSFDTISAFAAKMKKKNTDIENEILNFLPKELREYSTWNLSVIRVFNAWFLAGYGNKNVKVCIIDSGIDKNHVDLMKNVYIPEYSEQYEMTEDFYDFMVKNPTDSSGHGTHVTGIVGGVANGLGMVGVAPDVTLISLRFIDGVKYGGSFHAIKAINVCILNKTPIINASWGSNKYDANIYLAVQRLKYTFNGKGTVLVTAAGNENKNNDEHPLYPSNFKLPHVYSVASISKNFEISPFSNYGVKSVHIMAPGHHIYSTTPNNSYKINTGTSMAAPHVCGVNALIYSVCYNQGFIPSAEEVLDILTRTAIKIISRRRRTINDSLVNAEAAVLTTLLGGLWMQMDCHFVKFNLESGKKKHIPVVFSAYKKGIYETDIVIAVISTEENSNVYGEILIPIRIVTDPKVDNFKESPRTGKKMIIDENEASHDEVLSYICENALYNLYEMDSNFLVTSLVLFFVAFILMVVGTIIFIKRKRHSKYCDDEDHYHNILRSSVLEQHHILGNTTNQQLEVAKRNHAEKMRHSVRFSLLMGKQNACLFKERASQRLNF